MKARLTGFKTEKLPDSKIIGRKINCLLKKGEENPIPAFWSKCFSDGTIAKLEVTPDRLFPDLLLGWCGDFKEEENSFYYLIGVLVKPEAVVPEGMESIDLPGGKYAVGTIEGQEPDIFRNAHQLTEQQMNKEKMAYDPVRRYEIEWYDDRFCRDNDKRVIDLYIPVK
jgi:predicted transcriptional regulator YdeE